MKDLKQLEQKYEALGKEIEALKTEKIKVPDCIKIETYSTGEPQGIVNNGQMLYLGSSGKWIVTISRDRFFSDSTHLVPIARADLKAGDVAYRTDQEPSAVSASCNRLQHYCIILDESEYIFWNANSKREIPILIHHQSWTHWYKVVNG